jgi:tetratricopeptide (TPR) repeat protein
MKLKFSIFFVLSATLFVLAQSADKLVSKGNEYYREAQFDLAEMQYKQAIQQDPGNTTAYFNLANSLHQQKKYSEAKEILKQLNGLQADDQLKSAAHYNTGVTHSKQKELEESIEAYKNALRLKPDDQQARENLQKALLELKKKQQQQQQQQNRSSSMSQNQAEQKLKQLQEKEKNIQQRLQKNNQKGGAQPKDW